MDLDNVCKAEFDVFPNAGLSFLIISWEKEHQLVWWCCVPYQFPESPLGSCSEGPLILLQNTELSRSQHPVKAIPLTPLLIKFLNSLCWLHRHTPPLLPELTLLTLLTVVEKLWRKLCMATLSSEQKAGLQKWTWLGDTPMSVTIAGGPLMLKEFWNLTEC